MPGHFFAIRGDLNQIHCDALLIPTDAVFTFEPAWNATVDLLGLPGTWARRRVVKAEWKRGTAGPRVWLGNVGTAGDVDLDHYTAVIEEFIDAALRDLERDPSSSEIGEHLRVPRLAVPLVGSGKGGAAFHKGGLVDQVVRTLATATAAHEVDLVLVLWRDRAYAAVQHARRRLELEPRFRSRADRDRLDPVIDRLAEAARLQHLVLFLGAGVSAGAGLPTWSELIGETAAAVLGEGTSDDRLNALVDRDLRDAASILENMATASGPGRTVRSIIADLLGKYERYSLAHGLLASLPACEAVTTNYDELFERAARAGERPLAVLPDAPIDADGRWLLKLHGTLSQPERMVLTRADYLNMPRQYGALMGLVQAMLLMRHMLFVGYSLTDEDFHELIYEVRQARNPAAGAPRKVGTVLTLFKDPLADELWQGELEVVPMLDELKPSARRQLSRTRSDAGRTLEVFLDILAYRSATNAAFLLDDTYEELLDDRERQLRQLLLALANSPAIAAEAAGPVKELLTNMGWSQRVSRP
jgi:hypothetical protein